MAIRTPLESADHAAKLLYARGARRVWAFGSLGEGHALDIHSDVDLAVEGLAPDAIEHALAELRATSPCKVDIVAMEETDAQLRWFVARGRMIPRDGRSLGNTTRTSLQRTRLEVVLGHLRAGGARRVLDLGCGPGWLIELLATEPQIDAVLGIDKDDRALTAARQRLDQRLAPAEARRVTLEHGLFTWRDPRLQGYDAVVATEVIEHLERPQLAAFVGVVFGFVMPQLALITTPNADYNVRLRLERTERRHPDHRFEWTRRQFERWGRTVAKQHGYRFEAGAVGAGADGYGPPTQLGVFRRGHADG